MEELKVKPHHVYQLKCSLIYNFSNEILVLSVKLIYFFFKKRREGGIIITLHLLKVDPKKGLHWQVRKLHTFKVCIKRISTGLKKKLL
jgi:hypothetical protein